MELLHSLKTTLGISDSKANTPVTSSVSRSSDPEPDEFIVPEIDALTLMAEGVNDVDPILLDCRETWERRQARIPDSLHIPMNDIPSRINELATDTPIVVVCAHGSRSYGVAGYLIQHGYQAVSLRGGVTAWRALGGVVESDYPR